MSFVSKAIGSISREHGTYILIAVTAFIASIVTLFVNSDAVISVKWLIAAICISLTTVIILVRTIAAIGEGHRFQENIRVIKYFPKQKVLLIRTSFDLPVHSLLSVFVTNHGYEELYAIGYVENVQEKKVASLRIVREYSPISKDTDLAIAAIVKTTLPYQVLKEGQL